MASFSVDKNNFDEQVTNISLYTGADTNKVSEYILYARDKFGLKEDDTLTVVIEPKINEREYKLILPEKYETYVYPVDNNVYDYQVHIERLHPVNVFKKINWYRIRSRPNTRRGWKW